MAAARAWKRTFDRHNAVTKTQRSGGLPSERGQQIAVVFLQMCSQVACTCNPAPHPPVAAGQTQSTRRRHDSSDHGAFS